MGLENLAFSQKLQELGVHHQQPPFCFLHMSVAVLVVRDFICNFFQSLQMPCSEVLWIFLLLSVGFSVPKVMVVLFKS